MWRDEGSSMRMYMRGARGPTAFGAALSVLGLFAGVVAAASCGEDFATCYEGDFRACTCGDGAEGYQSCRPAENAFAPCRCDGTTPGVDPGPPDTGPEDASSGDGADALDAAPRKYMEPCEIDQQCETGLCGSFGARGRVCTKLCGRVEDCPPPADACNASGFCRPPAP